MRARAVLFDRFVGAFYADFVEAFEVVHVAVLREICAHRAEEGLVSLVAQLVVVNPFFGVKRSIICCYVN